MIRSLIALVVGAAIGFGVALWFQGEPPFAGSASTASHEISLTLSDAFLTRVAAPQIVARSNGSLSHVTLTSAEGDMVFVEAQAAVAGVKARVGLSGSPRAAGGTVVLDVRSVHAGPLPVPDLVVSPVVRTINSRIEAVIAGSDYRVVGAGTTTTGVEVFLRQA